VLRLVGNDAVVQFAVDAAALTKGLRRLELSELDRATLIAAVELDARVEVEAGRLGDALDLHSRVGRTADWHFFTDGSCSVWLTEADLDVVDRLFGGPTEPTIVARMRGTNV
jgi:hypothetical protein